MLHPAAISFILSSTIYVYDILNDSKQHVTRYIIIFLLMMGTLYCTRCNAGEISDYQCMINPGDEDFVPADLPLYSKYMKHRLYMEKYYYYAQERTWYLPDYTDKEKASLCFSSAVALAVPPNSISKIIAIALGLFTKYGLDCIDGYHEINHYLCRAKYHADMQEFYWEIIMKSGMSKAYVVIHTHVDEEDQ